MAKHASKKATATATVKLEGKKKVKGNPITGGKVFGHAGARTRQVKSS